MNQVFEDILRLGGTCYFTGSCVRNKLLGAIKISDYDIVVLHIPIDVILKSLIDSGNKPQLQNNIIHVIMDSDWYHFIIMDDDEFKNRANGFTIDLILVDCFTGKVFDPHKGVNDLTQKILRLPDKKILLEQPALMLDAGILCTKLNFKLNVETWFSIYDNARLIKVLDPNIAQQKLLGLLNLDKPSEAFRLLQDLGLLLHILPEVSACETVVQSRRDGVKNVFEHIMFALDASENNETIRLAVLFHDVGKKDTIECAPDGTIHFFRHEVVGAELTKKRMKVLNFSTKLITKVSHLVNHHMFDPDPKLTDKGVRRLIRKVGEDHIYDLIKVKEADRQGAPDKISMKKIKILKNKITKELQKKNADLSNKV